MSELLAQLILARRSDDAENWMSILVFVILAIIWAIGGIVKAKANKPGDQDEQSPGKPIRKPPLHSREAREQMLRRLERPAGSAQGQSKKPRPAGQQPRMKFADLQAAVRKFAVEAEKAFQADTREHVPKSRPQLTEPQIKTEKPQLTEPMTTIKGLHEKQVSEPAQMPESEYLSELLTDYSDPEELRMAILHYEILGRPLSLRDPSENSTRL